MTVRKYSSRSQKTTLSASITSVATTANVVSGTSLMGGATLSAGQTYTVVIDPDTALEEIVDVTAVSTNTLTIVRGIDGSSAVAHSAGAEVRHMSIGRDFREANEHIENTTTAHGLTIANVLETTDTNMITTAMLQANAVTTAKITDANVTTAKIADSAVTSAKIADLTIASGDIADGAITSGKIATGAVGTVKIDDLSVTEGKLAPSAVTAGKIATDAVTTTKILDANVTTAKIADSAITSAKIADGTIVAGDIADGAVTSAKILDGTIATGDLADGAVTSAKIADGTIVDGDVSATAAIAKTKLNLGGTITSADLVDGTIVNADINAAAGIALSKLATDPLARANHTGTQAASTISDFDTQVRTSRLDQMAAPTAAVALNAQKITGLADPTNAQDAVTLNYITTQKGVANGLAELDGSGLVPTHHLPALAITTTQVVSTQAAMLALTAQIGDVAVRTDVNKSFILTATPATTLANWQELLTPTDAVLSVDGGTGAISLSGTYLNRTTGQLLGNLDANNFKVTGLGTPTSNADAATKSYVDAVAGSATAAAASAAAAETTYDNFDDRYLGAKSSAPTLDNDGNALITGALYWNSVSNTMFAWTGSAWGSISSTAAIYRYRYTAAGGETSESGLDDNGLTLSYLPGKEQVYLNGVLLARTSDYNATDGTSITGLAALAAGDILEIITFTAFDLATAIDKALFDAKGDILVATAADTPGKLTAGTNGYVLKANSATATGLEWADLAGTTITVPSGSTVPLTIQNNGTGASFVVNDEASDVTPFVIDGAGNVRVNSIDGYSSSGISNSVFAISTTDSGQGMSITNWNSGTGASNLQILKSRGTTVGTRGAVVNGDSLGIVRISGDDGTNFISSVRILAAADNTVSTGVVPGRLIIETANSSGTLTERMRIDSNGRIRIPTTGVLEAPLVQNAQTASYTTVLADAGKLVEMNVATANNLTVPLNSSVAYPVGTQINILQVGAGQTTVVATGGVTINATPGLKLRAQWSSATLIKRATDTWVLVGDLSA